MPSGYEKSPDYGGKPPTWRSEFSFIAFLLIVFLGLPTAAYLVFGPPPPKCWTLGKDEIQITEVNGRQQASLDLSRIPKGECVTIDTRAPLRRPSQDLP